MNICTVNKEMSLLTKYCTLEIRANEDHVNKHNKTVFLVFKILTFTPLINNKRKIITFSANTTQTDFNESSLNIFPQQLLTYSLHLEDINAYASCGMRGCRITAHICADRLHSS